MTSHKENVMNRDQLNALIDATHATERTTKANLTLLSRALLQYVPNTKDIGMVNRLIGGLTPMNKKTAILFFKAFLPWTFDEGTGMFGAMNKGEKSFIAKLTAITAFLEVGENDIWTWAETNVKVEKKPVDYAARIANLIGKAIADEENGLTQEQLIRAIINGGVSVSAIIEQAASIHDEVQAAQADETLAIEGEKLVA